MPRPSQALRGQVAVVTDSTDGLGLHLAASLAQAGAQLLFSGREMAEVEALYQQFSAIPGVEVLGTTGDPTRAADVAAMAELVQQRFGALHLWVCHTLPPVPHRSTLDLSSEQWRATFEDAFLPHLHAIQGVLPRLRQRGGALVHVLALEAKQGSAFAAAQAAALRLMEEVAQESDAPLLALDVGATRHHEQAGERLVQLAREGAPRGSLHRIAATGDGIRALFRRAR